MRIMTITCYIKKKRGLCKRSELQKIDTEIAEKKEFYQTMVNGIDEIENMIQDRQYHELWEYEMPLYDGFNYQNIQVQHREDDKECPYFVKHELCEELVSYKKEVLAYQNKKVNQYLQRYNQVACVLFALQHYDTQKYSIKDHMLLYLNKEPEVNLSYFSTDDLNIYEDKKDELSIFHMITTTQVIIDNIPLTYKSNAIAMEGTYLQANDTKEFWFEVESRFLQESICETVLKSLQEIVQFLRRHGKKMAGVYIPLNKTYLTDYQKIHFNELGYHLTGKVVHSQFKEDQVLLWKYAKK